MQRWRDAALELGGLGKRLAAELSILSGSPCRQNALNAALAARTAQQATSGALWFIANATAAELESAAG